MKITHNTTHNETKTVGICVGNRYDRGVNANIIIAPGSVVRECLIIPIRKREYAVYVANDPTVQCTNNIIVGVPNLTFSLRFWLRFWWDHRGLAGRTWREKLFG